MHQFPQNPYYSTAVIKDPNLFFNRSTEIGLLLNSIFSGPPQCISIIGQRKIGKSSLAEHISRSTTIQHFGYSHDRHIFVYFDCQKYLHVLKNADTMYQQILALIRAALPSSIIDVTYSSDTTADHSGQEFEYVLNAISNEGLRIIIIFDEFEKAIAQEQLISDGFFGSLRGYTQSNSNFAWITCTGNSLHDLFEQSFDEYHISTVQRKSESDFYNIAPVRSLSLFELSDTMDLVTIPSRNYGVEFSKEVVDAILRLSGNFPYFVQRSCYHFFNMQRGKNQTFEKTYEQCLEEFRILWEGFWQKLRNLEKSILFEIATRRTIDFKSPEIARLKDASLIYDAEKENYQPFSEEFCRFVQGKSTEVREESLILKNAKLLEEKTSLQEKIDRGKERESRQEALAIEAQQKVTATETIIIDKDEKIAAQDKRHKRDSLKIRLLLSVIFAIVSFSIIFLTPLLGKWTWFEQHPKKTNLYIIAVLFVCGISWIIIDTNLNRRLLIGGSLIIGLILTLLQIA